MESSRRAVVSALLHMVSVGLAAAGLVISGCSSTKSKADHGGSSTTAAVTTTSTAVVTTTTVDPTEAAVVAAYRAFWAAFLKAADPMNPQLPDLTATATGQQLEQVQKAFLAHRVGGEVIRGTLDLHPHVAGPVRGTTATVTDCYADDTHLFDAVTGAQKDKPGVVHQQVNADMVSDGTVWKVSAIHHQGEGCTPS
jgi:hypothetical protein